MSHLRLPRSAWTTTAPGFPRFANRRITPSHVRNLRLHYPGDGNHLRAGYSQAQVAAALRGYRNFHVGTRGWADIGYPVAVDQAGREWELAGETHAAAHSATATRPNENWHSMAIVLVIGNNEVPSAAMIATVQRVRARMRRKFTNMTGITAHRDVPGAGTACAGNHVTRLLRERAFDGAPTTHEEDDMAQEDVDAIRADLVKLKTALERVDPGIGKTVGDTVWQHPLADLAHPEQVIRPAGYLLEQARRHSERGLGLGATIRADLAAFDPADVDAGELAAAIASALPGNLVLDVAGELRLQAQNEEG